jgi:hypothetical protein
VEGNNFLVPGTLERALRSFVNPATWSLFGTFKFPREIKKPKISMLLVCIVYILQNFKYEKIIVVVWGTSLTKEANTQIFAFQQYCVNWGLKKKKRDKLVVNKEK